MSMPSDFETQGTGNSTADEGHLELPSNCLNGDPDWRIENIKEFGPKPVWLRAAAEEFTQRRIQEQSGEVQEADPRHEFD